MCGFSVAVYNRDKLKFCVSEMDTVVADKNEDTGKSVSSPDWVTGLFSAVSSYLFIHL